MAFHGSSVNIRCGLSWPVSGTEDLASGVVDYIHLYRQMEGHDLNLVLITRPYEAIRLRPKNLNFG